MKEIARMDWISDLPEALLLRILSLLPAKDVVTTMVLSKRWQFLWMLVPRLVYDDSYQNIEYGKFSRFVDRCLLSHEAPVLEVLHFKLGGNSRAEDIQVWTRAASKRCVRELIIEVDHSDNTTPAILPRSLYTGCRMLVELSLENVTLVDVVSASVSFPSLKALSLKYVIYPGDEFVISLFSNCPVLEDLAVLRRPNDNVTVFTIKVPCLKNVTLHQYQDGSKNGAHGFVIDAPSLKSIDICDYSNAFCIIENEMLNIVAADVDVTYSHPGNILSSIISVQRLYLCLSSSKDGYHVGSVFHSLVHLKICTCETEWLNLLVYLLMDSPKLKSLKLEQWIFVCPVGLSQCHELQARKPRPCWNEPSSVPECVLSSLETLKLKNYKGTEAEREVAAFILRNAKCLKKVTISSNSTDPVKKLEMIKDLSLSSRRSPTCQLAFD